MWKLLHLDARHLAVVAGDLGLVPNEAADQVDGVAVLPRGTVMATATGGGGVPASDLTILLDKIPNRELGRA